MTVNLAEKKSSCCGCTACASICPRGAIAMRLDAEGFAYPEVDGKKCVDCGLCLKACDFKASQERRRLTPSPKREGGEDGDGFPLVYGVRHRNVAIRRESQSGGLFTLISDPVLHRGGVVYGAGFRRDLTVAHARAETREQRDALRGSKYVQSDMGRTFLDVRADLKAGREVLFTGTPCQCAGLNGFLDAGGTVREGLTTAGLVCHGVPSPLVWKAFLDWSSERKGAAVREAIFRDCRRFGWHSHFETLSFEDGSSASSETYASVFYSHKALRPACHACPYACADRSIDISMGDFWGIERIRPTDHDEIGASLALVHSARGLRLFMDASDTMDRFESDLVGCSQQPLVSPTPLPPGRDAFWRTFLEDGFWTAWRRHVLPWKVARDARRAIHPLVVHARRLPLLAALERSVRGRRVESNPGGPK